MKDVQSLLQRLDSALGKKKPGQGGKIDYKELASLKAKLFLKLKEGRNSIVFITPEGAEDPFVFSGFHSGLQETAYWSVPCDKFNKEEECLVCKVVDDLKAENFEGNKGIWLPIRQQTEYYAPVIVVDSEATIEEGVKWLRLSKTIMTQLTEWLRNLEKDEQPFYSDDEPQKVIINYDKKASPMEQYKLDKKNYKSFKEEKVAAWRAELKPVSDFIISKSLTELTKIVDQYFLRIASEVATPEEQEPATLESKLNSIKNKS